MKIFVVELIQCNVYTNEIMKYGLYFVVFKISSLNIQEVCVMVGTCSTYGEDEKSTHDFSLKI
jgi:hypothetical protein